MIKDRCQNVALNKMYDDVLGYMEFPTDTNRNNITIRKMVTGSK